MSYILEALKKLERKRQQEETRPTLTLAEATETKTSPRAFWLTLLAVGLLLNALVLVWWVVFRGPYRPPRAAPAPPQRALAKPAPAAVPSPLTSPAADTDRREAAGERTLTPTASQGQGNQKASTAPPEKLPVSDPVKLDRPPEKRPQVPTIPKGPANQPPIEPPPKRVPGSEAVKTLPAPEIKVSASDRAKVPLPSAPKKEVLRSDRIFNPNELPTDVKSALPPLKISTHVYGPEPASRLVQVNEQVLQEGQELKDGIKVEEILPRGVVFRFQGYRFRMELP